MYERIKRLFLWKNGKKAGPVDGELNITNLCNLKCCYCNGYQSGFTKKSDNELTQEECLRIIREGKKLGIKEWHLAGDGEPLLKKEIFLAVAKEIKELGMKGVLTTNGTLLDEEIRTILINVGWDRIQISLQSPNEKIQDQLSGVKGSYKKTIKNVKQLQNLKGRKTEPIVNINVAVQKANYRDIDQIIKLAAELRVFSTAFHNLVVSNHKIKPYQLNRNQQIEFQKNIEKNIQLANKLRIHTNLILLKEKNILNQEKIPTIIMEQ